MKNFFLIVSLLASSTFFAQKDIRPELNFNSGQISRIIPGNNVLAAPANDACLGAVSLTPNGTCVNGTTVDATDSWNNTVGCQNGNAASNHPDVWYSFVATGSQLTLVTTGSGTWAGNVEITVVEFPAGSECLVTATIVGSDCGASPLTSTFNGLQAGNTYYFTISNASGGTTGPFSVCPTTADPPVVSGQDCGTAAVLCNNLNFTQGSSSAGFGTQEVSSGNSCFGGGERQSKWYKFTVGCSGTLEFMITPSNYNSSAQTGDDYDWALWNVSAGTCPTTANTAFDAVACNWSGCSGATGMSDDPLSSFSSAASTNYQANNPAGPGTCVPTGLAYQWENTINVTAGQTYALLIDNYSTSNSGFSFTFGGTASIGPDADFSYTATGCNAYNFTKTCQVSNSTFLWTFGDGNTSIAQNPSHTFTSSGVFTVTLEVTDNLGCTKTYSETFTVGFPDATAGSAQVITCTTPSVTVTGSSTVTGATYSWAGASIVSGGATASALVNASGTYTLTVTNPANSCTNTVTVSVTTNTTTPNVSAGSDATITCASTSTTLSGSSSTGGATFSWAGPSITAGAATATPTVNAAGTYTLTVTNPVNGCTATDQAVVTPDSNIPNASAGSDQSLTCSVTSLNLNGSSSTGGVNFAWTGTGITAGGATATATVNAAGTYTLTVTNPGNGCTATDQVIVALNNTAPNANAGSDAIITCSSPTVGLTGSSTTGGVSYSWAGTGITSGAATTAPTINAAGNFTLTVINPVNGCTATDVAAVATNTTLPNASAGSAQVIDCGNSIVPLSGSSTTGGVSFAWTGPTITAGATNASATVGAAGSYTLTVTNPANGCVNTSTVAVTTNTVAPNVNAGSDATLTCAITSLNLTGSSSTGGATFLWAGPGITTSPSTNTITVNATGTYTLTVTNPANGCTATDQAVVSPDANLPNANAGSDATLTCTISSLVLTGSSSTPSVTYLWTGPGITAGAATATPTLNAAGTYTLTVTNTANGCQSTDQAVVVLNNTNPNVSVGSPASLTCTTTTLNLLGSSSTSGVSFAWTGTGITAGAATATATVNAAGTFTLTVTDPSNGCVSATSTIVASNTTIPNANAGSAATLTCTVLSVVLNGSSTTPSPSYEWTGTGIVSGGTTSSPTVNAAGTFTLTVTDPTNGCTAQSTVVVSLDNTAPTVNAGSDATIICSSPTIGLTGSSITPGVTYLWSGAGITTNPASNTISVNAAGNYTLTVTNPVNGCTATDLANVTLDANIPDANAGASQELNCSLLSLILTGSSTVPTVSYSWAGVGIVSGGATASATVNQLGTYTLTVLNTSNGCSNTATVSVTQNTTQPTITPGSDQVLNCSVTSVVVSASSVVSGLTYTWTGTSVVSGGATNAANVDAAGTYSLTVVNPANGCSNSTTVNVLSNTTIPNVNAGVDPVLTCLNSSISLNGSSSTAGVTYGWSGGNIVSGGTTATPTIDAVGTYTLVVTDPTNGCTATDNIIVTLNIAQPNADAGLDAALTCGLTSVVLNATSSTPNISYSWAGPGVVSGGATASVTVNVSGSYTVTITDNTNGCASTDVADVIPDSNLPNANAGSAQILDCNITSVVLTGSSTTPGVDFSWAGGNIVSGATTNAAIVDAVATYTLTVFNTGNGCSNTATVSVTQNITQPTITPDADQTINCTTTSVTVSASSSIINLSYAWTGGNVVSGGTTNAAIVDAAGTYTLTVVDPTNGCSNTTTVNVFLNNTVPNVDAGFDGVITCTNPTLNLSGSSSTSGANVSWAGGNIVSGGTTLTPTVDAAGTYTLTVINPSNGCVATDDAVITLNNTQPNADAGLDAILTCGLPSVTLNATSSTSNVSYSWAGPSIVSGGSTASATVNISGSYTVTVTDISNGCASTDVADVTLDSNAPNVDAGAVQTLNCNITSVVLTGSSTTAGVDFSWAGPNVVSGGATITATVDAAGTYTLTVLNTANGCSNTDVVVVSIDTIRPIANAGVTQFLTCTISTVTLSGSSNPITVNYAWTGAGIISGGTTATPSVNAVGTYTLIVTDQSNGCQSNPVLVDVNTNTTAPDLSVSAVNPITCAQLTTNVGASSTTTNASFVWSGAGVVSGGTTNTAVVNASGTFTVTVTDPSNGCTTFSTSVVTVDASVPVITANASVPTITCSQTTSVLTASSSATSGTLVWNDAAGPLTGNPVNVTTAGNYTVTAVDNVNGCAAQQTVAVGSDLVVPNVVINPIADINCGTNQIDLISLTNAVNPAYVWTGPNFFSSISANTTNAPVAGTYSLSVTNQANGCIGNATVIVTQTPNPIAAFTTSTTSGFVPLPVQFSNSSQNANIYTWYFGNGDSSLVTNPSFNYGVAGNYVVTLVASNGAASCNDTATTTITVFGEATVVVPNIFSPNGDGINDVLTIQSSGFKELDIIIFNRWGSLIASYNAIGGNWSGDYSSEGTYYYILKGKRIDDKEFESHGAIMLVK